VLLSKHVPSHLEPEVLDIPEASLPTYRTHEGHAVARLCWDGSALVAVAEYKGWTQ